MLQKTHREKIEFAIGNKRDQFKKQENQELQDLDTQQYNKQNLKNDPQYQEILSEVKNPSKKLPALQDLQKYEGRKVTRKEIFQANFKQRIQSSSEQSEDEEYKNLKNFSKQIVEQSKNKAYLQDKLKVDDIMEELEEEDKEQNEEIQTNQESEIEKARSVRQQIQIWKEFVFSRFSMNKSLELIKKYPHKIDRFVQKSNRANVKYLELYILRNIDLLHTIKSNLQNKCQTGEFASKIVYKNQIKQIQNYIHEHKINQTQYETNSKLQIESLWEQAESQMEINNPWMEENILKWSQKTQLLNSINLKRSGIKALLQSPIGQAKKALEQIDKMIFKSQLKRSVFRILGEGKENVQQENDSEIYDDNDLYTELLKEYMVEIEENKEIGKDGLLFDSTRLYLLDRKLRQQEKKQSVVDRRVSKARKIRYDVHQKLVNFMNPCENKFILERRNQIVGCLFGSEITKENQTEEKIEKKVKLSEKGKICLI